MLIALNSAPVGCCVEESSAQERLLGACLCLSHNG